MPTSHIQRKFRMILLEVHDPFLKVRVSGFLHFPPDSAFQPLLFPDGLPVSLPKPLRKLRLRKNDAGISVAAF